MGEGLESLREKPNAFPLKGKSLVLQGKTFHFHI
jgi:hypothetical protein